MKKTFTKIMLLLFALVVGIGNAWAENITFNATSGSGTDVSWSTAQNQAGNAPAYNTSASELRLYPKCTITISSSTKKIASVSFTYSANVGGKNDGKATPTGVSVDTGTIDDFYTSSGSNAQGATGQTATWTADNEETSSFTITVNGAKGNYGFVSASVTFVEGGGTPLTPVSISLSGDYPTTFFVGDAFSHQGMVVTATFDDNSQSNVTSSAEFTGYDMSQAGNQTVTVSYTSNETVVTTTYGITVNAIPDKTIAQFISAGGGKCYLTGTVSNIQNTTYGNFDLTDASGTIYVYGCLNSSGQSGQFSSLYIVANDIIKVLANEYQLYNSKDEAVNVIFVEEIVPNAQTLTVSATNGSVEITGKTLVNNSCEVTEGASVTATATPADHYTFTSWSANGVTLANNTANPLTFTMPTNGVTLTASFTEDAKHTATFHVLNSSTNASVYEGAAITFPSVTAPNGYIFMGWTTSAIDGIQDDAPETLVSTANMGNDDVNYYAVFAIQSVSSTPATLTTSEITSNFTSAAMAYDNDPKSYTDSNDGITWTVKGYAPKSAPWIQLRKNSTAAYLKIAASNNISNIRFTITNTTTGTGQSTSEISNHGAFSGYIVLLSSATGNASEQTSGNLGYTNSVSNNIANVSPTSSVNEVYVQVTAAARIWNVEVMYVSYSRYCTSVSEGNTAINVVGGSITNNELTGEGTIAANTAVSITNLTIKSGAKLIVEGALATASPDNLIIEDGGQLVLNSTNKGVQATFEKDITSAAKDVEGNWYTISTPTGGINITSVTNLVDNEGHTLQYNLFRYDEPTHMWEAYNTTNHATFTTLEKGRGYLYRNNDQDLAFAGEVNVGDVENITLYRQSGVAKVLGFNLIGNPFGHNIYKGEGASIDNTDLADGFYYLNNNGGWQAGIFSTPIAPQMGILVQVSNTEITSTSLTIKDNTVVPTEESKYANDNLMFSVSNNDYEDVTYAMFHKGYGLNKINHRNADIPMLYINHDNDDYAIAMLNDDTKAFNLNFEAKTSGKYTLSYKAEGEFTYLHVIDRLTGADVDMLMDGEYSFIATPNDNKNRFIVSLGYIPDYGEGNNDIFAFQSGNEILVSGSGELQIFDITGRSVMSTTINGAESINLSAQGVYILRLVGAEVKTQKIVVK